ncbi:aldo/keto reductase [Streptomyces sp. NBC_01304]|uniref:aldo/keto reductase n=1 Tax=Streptomyces sp. NBC_01304 TaxID=2903818 RepID=UPI002E11E3E3|nr:aldo/keto reductase [Streptomyces sp. NBC_01304]
MTGIRSRRLGRTDVEVSELSYGGAGIGNLFAPVTDADAAASVEAAWDAGIRYFDTAPHYGLGLSERRLGEVLRGRDRSTYTISTKVGRRLEPVAEPTGDDLRDGGFAVPNAHRRIWDFSADGVRRTIESSLERLGLDRVDVVYLHDPDNHGEEAFRDGYPALEQLRAEGMVGAIGAGMNQAEMLTRFVRDTDIDAVLCAGRYTLIDHEALAELLPAAEERGTSIVIGGVYNSGLLADPKPGARFNYQEAPDELLDRARSLAALAERHGTTLRAAALAFPFGHPSVASVLIGVRSPAQVVDGAEQFATEVPADFWKAARAAGHLPPEVPVPGEVRP